MQITNLNKAISYTIVGLFNSLCLMAFGFLTLWRNDLFGYLKPVIEQNLGILASGLLATLIFSAAVFLGVVNEGLTRVLVRNNIEAKDFLANWHTLLQVETEYRDHQISMKAFTEKFQAAGLSASMPFPSSKAEALFFEKSSEAIIKYTTTHYASYILTTNFLFSLLFYVLPVFIYYLFSGPFSILILVVFTILFLLAVFALASLSARLYLYSYGTVYNHACLFVDDSAQNSRLSVRKYWRNF